MAKTKDKEPVFPTLAMEHVQKALIALKADFLALVDEYVEPVSLIEEIDLTGMKVEMDSAFATMEDELKDCSTDIEDMDADKVLDKLHPDDIFQYLRFKFPALLQVKVSSIEEQEKIRAFLETEIHTRYNDQRDNILF